MAYGEPSGASARMNVLENVRYVPDGTEAVTSATYRCCTEKPLTLLELSLNHRAQLGIYSLPIQHPCIDAPLARLFERMLRLRYRLSPPSDQLCVVCRTLKGSDPLVDACGVSQEVPAGWLSPRGERNRIWSGVWCSLDLLCKERI